MRQIGQTFTVVQIVNVAVMLQVEGDILACLSNWNHVLTQSVSDTGFIEHIRFLFSKVAYNDI